MKQLKTIQIPATVTKMEVQVFWGSGLETFDWPEHLTTIPQETFRSCDSLQSINIPATVDSIEYGVFLDCTRLRSLRLPEGIRTIHDALCLRCDSLREVVIPQTVTYIGSSAFSRTGLTHIDLPDHLAYIGRFAFENVPLEELHLPASLRMIEDNAFSGGKYSRLVVPEGVVSIDDNCFSSDSLRYVDFPSTLTIIGSQPFGSMQQAPDSIVVRCPVPPKHWQFFSTWGKDREGTLYVPRASLSLYQADTYFSQASNIAPIDIEMPRLLRVSDALTISAASGLQEGKYDVEYVSVHPDMNYTTYSYDHPRMEVEEGAAFHAGQFKMIYHLDRKYSTDYKHDTFINRGTFTADDIDINCMMYGRHMLTPPFDVAYDDLVAANPGVPIAFYSYDPAARAASKFDKSWVKVQPGEVLKSGQAYCFRSDRVLLYDNDGNIVRDRSGYPEKTWPWMHMSPKAGGTDHFSTADDVTLALTHNASEFAHNANWNFVGMPYPAFFDIRGLDYDGPIIVWTWGYDFNMYDDMWGNNGGWKACSPLDDEVVLDPMHAFFVQAPDSISSLTFDADRRQNSAVFKKDNTQNSRIALRRADQQRRRVVYNAILSRYTAQEGEPEELDRTRFVINPAATLRYDIGRDAPKMSDADGPANLLYTTADGVAYAINERPLADGLIRLTVQTAEAGQYTLAFTLGGSPAAANSQVLGGIAADEAVLIDLETGTRTPVTEPYTFTVGEAGTLASRFVVALGGADPTAIADQEQVLPLRSEGLFNLAGQKVGNASQLKGVYIKNGKKVIKQ